jgi:hypothetical protein
VPTQKSRIHGGGSGAGEGPQDPREDLDAAQAELENEQQGGGYGPPPLAEGDFLPPDENMQEIAGHQVRKVDHAELMRLHNEETGGAPIFENFAAPDEQAMAQARRAQQMGNMQQEVDEMTPEWMRGRMPQQPPQAAPNPAPRETTAESAPRLDMGGADEGVGGLKVLNHRATEAQAEGDLMGAKALRDAIQSIAGATDMRREYKPIGEHHVLQKLKSSLGLQKIKPVRKEWAGLAWNCYPANVILDAWFLDNIWDDQRNFSALKLASYCVGLDDVPLYAVFGIPLHHHYEITVPGSKGEEVKQKLKIDPYRKVCKTCGIEVAIDPALTECKNCGAQIDPFVVPMALRLRCAETLYQFLQEEFGPTERLDRLVSELRDMIADRFADMDELYPLAKLSDEAPKTDDSPSGEDQ